MKRIISFVILLCLCCFTLMSCFEPMTECEIVSDKLGVDVSFGQLRVYTDTHCSFHGDGETYAEIVFSDDSFCNAIKDNTRWDRLPLTQNLTVVVYGGLLSNGDSWESFIKNDNDEPLVPMILNGYYFFKDRSSESKNENDDSLIFDRSSMNFTLAIYDSDSKTLYFYEIDT